MEEHKKKAFDGALDLVKQLITLSTGTLALTAAFLKDIISLKPGEHIPYKTLLFFVWGSLLLSLLCGLFAHGAITGTLDGIDDSENPPKKITIYTSSIQIWTVCQSLIFYLGIVLLICYMVYVTP